MTIHCILSALAIQLGLAGAQTQDPYAAKIHVLMTTKSRQELDLGLDRLDREQLQTRFCRAELRGNQVPVHCLQLLRSALVSRLCQRAVMQIHDVTEIRTILPQLTPDKDCLEAAERRKQRLEYMHPELITEAYST